MRKIIYLLFSLFIVLVSVGQEDYYDENYLRYDDYVYSENFKSVQLFKTGFELSAPIIHLGSNETLTLTFDDLNVEAKTFYYTFILCNADWTPADLLPMEYIDGMPEDFFNNNSTSFNTTIQYSHYRVRLPSENMRLTKAGNYLLKVYAEGDSDNPIITRRMYVMENRVEVFVEKFIANSPLYRDTHHELFIKVDLKDYPMPNIYEDFTMVVRQNGRKDNEIVRRIPKVMTNEYLHFNTASDILFNGGNEYRVLDIRSLKVQSARVDQITFDRAGYQVAMLQEESRNRKQYLQYSELNGEYLVLEWDNTQLSDQIEADYAFVNFSFKSDSVFENGGIYLMGALTNWRIDNSSRLTYDRLTKTYNTTLLLKQGYYDYHYVYVPDGEKEATVVPFEGNHSEAVNTYTVFVYYRDQGEYWDKLIGFYSAKSN